MKSNSGQGLFSTKLIDDFISAGNKKPSASLFGEDEFNGILFKKNDELINSIPTIKMDSSIHYATAGLWSSHELLDHLLNFTGPAKVFLCTWSIKEMPVRMLVGMIASERITELHCLFDNRVKTQTPEVFHLVKLHAVNARQSVCHAKVTIIENDQWSITIIGSANYTNNPRIEAGVICCNKEISDFHKKWIMEEINNSHPFDNE